MHLSVPYLNNIDDGIDKESYSLRYSVIDDATQLIAKAGPGCFLSKVDINSAFHLMHTSEQAGLGLSRIGSFSEFTGGAPTTLINSSRLGCTQLPSSSMN